MCVCACVRVFAFVFVIVFVFAFVCAGCVRVCLRLRMDLCVRAHGPPCAHCEGRPQH